MIRSFGLLVMIILGCARPDPLSVPPIDVDALARLERRAERAACIVDAAHALRAAETRVALAVSPRERRRARSEWMRAVLALRDATAPVIEAPGP